MTEIAVPIGVASEQTDAFATEATTMDAAATEAGVTEVAVIKSCCYHTAMSGELTTESPVEDITTKKPTMKICLHKGMIIQNLAKTPASCAICGT